MVERSDSDPNQVLNKAVHYFGVPCWRCGESLRYIRGSQCVNCLRIYNRERYRAKRPPDWARKQKNVKRALQAQSYIPKIDRTEQRAREDLVRFLKEILERQGRIWGKENV